LHHHLVIHRDLNPRNVIVAPSNDVVLCDFELSHALTDPRPPFAYGTPGFVSPQQDRGLPPSPADDVYALGALIACRLTACDVNGLAADEVDATIRRSMRKLPATLSEIMNLCLSSRPEQRPSTKDLLRALASAGG
jgi:serine/threonine protein kinase